MITVKTEAIKSEVNKTEAIKATIKNLLKNSVKRSKHANVPATTTTMAPAALIQKLNLSSAAASGALIAGIGGTQFTKDNSFKHLNQFHPRIKYSKHKNPIIHHHPIVAKNLSQSLSSSSSTSTSTSSHISPTSTKLSPPSITTAIPTSHALARAIWSTDARSLELHHLHRQQQQQFLQNLHQKTSQKLNYHHDNRKAQIPDNQTHVLIVPSSNVGNETEQKAVLVQDANQSSSAEITTTSIIMTDIEHYAEIDDIQLPDGSQIGFGDDEMSQHEDRKYSSASVDDEYSMAHYSNHATKFEYLSDSAISANNEEGNRQYICRHCGKRYRWKSTLRRHENVECGGKEPLHQCPHCPYKAKQRGNLGVHIRKHHGAMPPLESRRKSNKSLELQERSIQDINERNSQDIQNINMEERNLQDLQNINMNISQ